MPGLFDPAKNDACKIHFYEVARSLVRQGHRVNMLVPRCHAEDLPLEPNLRLITLPLPYRERLWYVFFLSLVQLVWYARAVTSETDAVYVRWRMLPARFLGWINIIKGISPIMVTEHNGWVEDEVRVQHDSDRMVQMARYLQLTDAESAHGVVAVVDGIAERLPKAVRTIVVDNGTNLERFRPLSDRDRIRIDLLGDAGGPVIGFSGNISRWQGVDNLIHAFAHIADSHPNARLVIVGDGPCLDEVRELAQGLSMADRIHFSGDVVYEDMNRWLNTFDLAVVPKTVSLAHIGYSPLKVRDSAAAGVAVAATRVRGLTELEPHGWLATWNPSNKDGLALLLEKLLSDPAQLETMGRTARIYAEAHFSWDDAARSVAEFMESLEEARS